MRKEIINIATELWGTPETNDYRNSWRINNNIEFDLWSNGSYGLWKTHQITYIFDVSNNCITITIL